MDAISEHVYPWEMLYVNDVIDNEEAGIQTRLTDWQKALERKGLTSIRQTA